MSNSDVVTAFVIGVVTACVVGGILSIALAQDAKRHDKIERAQLLCPGTVVYDTDSKLVCVQTVPR